MCYLAAVGTLGAALLLSSCSSTDLYSSAPTTGPAGGDGRYRIDPTSAAPNPKGYGGAPKSFIYAKDNSYVPGTGRDRSRRDNDNYRSYGGYPYGNGAAYYPSYNPVGYPGVSGPGIYGNGPYGYGRWR